ncbi:regulator of G-protein signaling [Mactra antiquata]
MFVYLSRYQNLVDSAYLKGNISSQDTEFMSDKARSIISCYLASDISPKVQINVPNDMAVNIINNLASTGPTRGLFHEAVILLFPILYHYFRKYTEEWLNGDIPDDYLESIERTFNDHVSSTPHSNTPVPDYQQLKPNQFKTKVSSTFSIEEHLMRIHFSLSEGATLIYPQSKLTTRTTPVHLQGRRMTKASLQGLNEEGSPKRGDKGAHSDKKEHIDSERKDRHGKPTDAHSKHSSPSDRKTSGKIIVKEEAISNKVSEHMKSKVSSDKAKRLSMLVENLNKGREDKMKEQNRKYSKLMTFEEVVSAAIVSLDMSEIDTNSVFS